MNVLKKDLLWKTGAKAKRKPAEFSGTAPRGYQNPLAFLIPQYRDDDYSGLSQSSASSSILSGSYSYAGAQQPPPRTNDFELFMQPFINEVHSQRDSSTFLSQPFPENDSCPPVFKKPRPVASSANISGLATSERNDSASDVLKILELSSSQSVAEMNFRAPLGQNDSVDQQQSFLSGQDPDNDLLSVSSIQQDTTKSSGKKTPKTNTKTSLEMSDADYCIIAITEGRGHASGEVGIAAMDPRRPHLILCQISDSQRYTNSLSKMNVFNFAEAIVPNTFREGPTPRKLYLDLLERFPSVTVNHVQRRHFSESVGLQMIQQFCSKESESVMVVVKDKFYALAAAAALLKYIEFSQNILIAPRSLKIEFQGTDGTTIIDLNTASRLELVMGLVSREETHSLLGVLKHCRTKGGVRLLRANLLQPMANAAKTNSRLDCVTELIENPILFNALASVVSQMKSAESLLTLCMHPPQQSGLKCAQFQLKYTLLLKTTLELVPSLITALHDAKSDYFNYVRDNLQDTRLSSVLKRVLQTVNVVEGTSGNRKGALNPLHACFMIRAGINGLLDIAKKTYCEIAQEIADLVNNLKTKFELPLRLGFSQGKGYHIQISPIDRVDAENLPAEFILVQKVRNTLTCYTTELVALDQRCQQALHEIELMTNVLLFELLTDIRDEIACLFPLCECLAELDVCIAFAHVGANEGYVRPQFSDELRLVAARHPILDANVKDRVVGNDVLADADNNFIILTGPNQSGKSIYIRQIALLQVMAQIGCYVPAKEATFRIADRIFSRIGFDDSIESNASTLMVEMQDMEFIRKNLTSSSLVIIDELCRGTSVEEGTCLAFVLCEELLDTSAFIFFTTHFLILTKLESMYCNVRNFHFETELSSDGRPSLKFTHKMLEGVTPAEHYGIKLAALMGYPESILEVAKETAETLSAERKPESEICGLTSRFNITKAMRMHLPQDADVSWNQLLTVIRTFKTEYNKLPPMDEQVWSILENEIAANERMEEEFKKLSDSSREFDKNGTPTEEEMEVETAQEEILDQDKPSAQESTDSLQVEDSEPKLNSLGDKPQEEDAVTHSLQEKQFKIVEPKQPQIMDKSSYYEWKYSRNKKELKALAEATRSSPAAAFVATKPSRARSLTPNLRLTPQQQEPFFLNKFNT